MAVAVVDSMKRLGDELARAVPGIELVGTEQGVANSSALSLVVLYARNVEATKAFYSLLGVSFTREQHGSGPPHYAAAIGSMVFEIYPCRDGQTSSSVRLGFRVPSVEAITELLRARGARIIGEVKSTASGYRAVVEDPDGNRIELLSPPPLVNPSDLDAAIAAIPSATDRRPELETAMNG